MEILTEVLGNLRSSGALIDRSLLTEHWSVRVETGSSITVATLLRGSGWLHQQGRDAEPLGARDLAILTGRGPILLSSDLDGAAEPTCVVTAEGSCLDAEGAVLANERVGLDARVRRERLAAESVLLTGTLPTSGRIAERLLSALPNAVVVPREEQRSTALDLLESELGNDEPGQQAVLDRLLDLVLIGALRDWFALAEVSAPAWYGAAGDPVVGPALGALHADPAQEWTVASLARRAGVSRAAFARRFAEVMGEPPISYLSGWRLCQAADRLELSDDTLDSIARQVGYSSSFALSAAFTREYGMRPSRYRETTRARR
ncbi:cupin domain-containing protein [Brachybacterium sp. AOP43-C2-M15]|uniref:cupin domain-containing protein n=1 Tax=Brachybacterium sp. AOP43-C2-M15 TaxID=3457661 RepID=UPI004034ABD4